MLHTIFIHMYNFSGKALIPYMFHRPKNVSNKDIVENRGQTGGIRILVYTLHVYHLCAICLHKAIYTDHKK